MIGLMHQVLFAYVESTSGTEAVAAMREEVGIASEHVFRMDRSYPDDEWQKLVAAGITRSTQTAEQFEFGLGRFAADMLHAKFAGFFAGKPSLHEMLRRQMSIHNQLARTMPDEASRRAVNDKFQLVSDGDELVVHYRSPNDHLVLYRGIADRLTEVLGEPFDMQVEDLRVGSGADYILRMRFPAEARA